jgi:hypothetical protein
VTAASLRTYSTAAAIPACLVVLAHLALEWNGANGYSGRRDLAFSHGVALAILLAAVLAASRFALHIERGGGAPLADTVGIAGTVAVLANLARVWRDNSNPLDRVQVTAGHIAALLVVAAVTQGLGQWERSRSNRAPSMEIPR